MLDMIIPTRAAALSALNDFLPRIRHYSANRSFARPGNPEVSRLSPYIRRRLITEQEVVQGALESHSFEIAEKFIQEVVWRTYWKGWLELHPWVWDECVKRETILLEAQSNSPWDETYSLACRGETHLSFFNEWVGELLSTGYLHNHVRMWFASVWVFTLKIPWQLGAMFMYRHLLDGDPASNTLSWRWVAGLQTKGKSYLAKADNIHRYSDGRWSPAEGELAEETCHIADDVGPALRQSMPREWRGLPKSPYGVLTTSEDLSLECVLALIDGARATALWRYTASLGESEIVKNCISCAEDDALIRLGASGVGVSTIDEVKAWVKAAGLTRIVIAAPAVGPLTAPINIIADTLSTEGINVSWYRRLWDAELHPLATKGFFPFWEKIKGRIKRGEDLFCSKGRPVD